MKLYPNDVGNLVIQFITIVEKGVAPSFRVIGYKGGFWGQVLTLFCWQTPQLLMYC